MGHSWLALPSCERIHWRRPSPALCGYVASSLVPRDLLAEGSDELLTAPMNVEQSHSLGVSEYLFIIISIHGVIPLLYTMLSL